MNESGNDNTFRASYRGNEISHEFEVSRTEISPIVEMTVFDSEIIFYRHVEVTRHLMKLEQQKIQEIYFANNYFKLSQ